MSTLPESGSPFTIFNIFNFDICIAYHYLCIINYKYALHMKKKGSTSDFIGQRNAELRAAFFSGGVYSTCDSVMKKTVRTPASRFWVDPDRARDMISRIEKDPGFMESMNPERRRMYEALYRKYREIQISFPGKSKIRAVTMAIYSGAPEFFLSASRARSIIYNKQ